MATFLCVTIELKNILKSFGIHNSHTPLTTQQSGARPGPYCVEPVLFWDQYAFWPELEPTCVHCQSRNCRFKGWSNGKTIDDLSRTFRFFARRILCNDCHRGFNSDREEVLGSQPEFVRLAFKQQCGEHTYKKGVTANLESAVNFFAASQESLSSVQRLTKEIQGDNYAHTLNLYSSYEVRSEVEFFEGLFLTSSFLLIRLYCRGGTASRRQFKRRSRMSMVGTVALSFHLLPHSSGSVKLGQGTTARFFADPSNARQTS